MPGAGEGLTWDEHRLADPHGQPDKAARVRAMFDAIAPTYERVNTVASAGRDRHWRRTAVQLAGIGPCDDVLDLACGTGDLARAMSAAGPRRTVGADFSAGMLRHAAAAPPPRPIRWVQGDGQRLPFASGSFSVVSCAFGVRNFQDLAAGLREMRRVLRPGGRAVIVEFALPRWAVARWAYRLYFNHVLPRLGRVLSGERCGAYAYLPKSVETFPTPAGLCAALRAAGFASAEARPMTLGVAYVCVARREEAA